MEIKVQLEDPALCEGCPFSTDRVKCKAGFTRTTARLVEFEIRSTPMIYFYGDSDYAETRIRSYPMRPQECVIATERAVEVIKKLPATKKSKKQSSYRMLDEHIFDAIGKYPEKKE